MSPIYQYIGKCLHNVPTDISMLISDYIYCRGGMFCDGYCYQIYAERCSYCTKDVYEIIDDKNLIASNEFSLLIYPTGSGYTKWTNTYTNQIVMMSDRHYIKAELFIANEKTRYKLTALAAGNAWFTYWKFKNGEYTLLQHRMSDSLLQTKLQ